jgi:hypothetical protein
MMPTDGVALLRRNRPFRRFYYARGASVAGSQWTYAAVPIVALAVYRDPLAAGIASGCGYGGSIAFGFAAGFIVDRVRPTDQRKRENGLPMSDPRAKISP